MFNTKKFMSTRFEPRTQEVKVPDLREFFEGKKVKAVWKVRGLTGQELGRANEGVERNKNISAILEGIVAAGNKPKVDAMRKLLGISDDTPQDIAKRLYMLEIGSVEPVADMNLCLKICTCFPIEFYELTHTITVLTGKGHVPGKAEPSGKTKKSKRP